MLLDDLTEEWSDELTPWTETEPHTPLQRRWAEDGVVTLKNVFSEHVLQAYEREWRMHNAGRPGGWPDAIPYMRHPALRRLVCDDGLARVLLELMGGEHMGVHLNLTGWVSTRRDWHRDQYLNEPYVGGFYAAVWIALDDIHPDAGPFQFVRGSHKGKPISQSRIRRALGPAGVGPDWPTKSEKILTPIFEEEIEREGLRVESYLPRRNDVLIWHGRLLHRGSVPNDPTLERRALIAHFSGVHHRPDMPPAMPHVAGGYYFPL